MSEHQLDENDHLELTFRLITEELAKDFYAKVKRPELSGLYNVLSAYAAQVRCEGLSIMKVENESPLAVLRDAFAQSPYAGEHKRQMTVVLPHDGNLKALWRNLTSSPAIMPVVERDSVKIDVGTYMGTIGYFVDPAENNGQRLVLVDQPEFIPPVHRPHKEGFEIL